MSSIVVILWIGFLTSSFGLELQRVPEERVGHTDARHGLQLGPQPQEVAEQPVRDPGHHEREDARARRHQTQSARHELHETSGYPPRLNAELELILSSTEGVHLAHQNWPIKWERRRGFSDPLQINTLKWYWRILSENPPLCSLLYYSALPFPFLPFSFSYTSLPSLFILTFPLFHYYFQISIFRNTVCILHTSAYTRTEFSNTHCHTTRLHQKLKSSSCSCALALFFIFVFLLCFAGGWMPKKSSGKKTLLWPSPLLH